MGVSLCTGRGVTGYNADDDGGEFTATLVSFQLCKTVLPLNTCSGKNTKSQLKYSLYFVLLRLVYREQ